MRPAPGDSLPTTTTRLRPILDVAAEVGLRPSELRLAGATVAKIAPDALARRQAAADGRTILVTSINPTPAGEGKTVTAIGLAQALRALGERAVVCLREPSMGPIFGMKGGATGGGRCTVEPSDDINLHFTGDFHAVTSAHNLLAAMVDDHIYRGRDPQIDLRRPVFHRVLDVNDRALRRVIVGGGGPLREDRFDITAASEVMAILALARDYADLRARLGRIVVATSRDGTPVLAGDLRAAGAMAALLRDALHPNLVQTREGGAAFVHAGPFANIAHGTSSLISLLLARKVAGFVVVEAGFGADLGAEKFVNIVGAHGGPHPDLAIIVATVRALKHHAGVALDALPAPDVEAVVRGLPNLRRHVAIVRRLGMRPVVCVNAFATDAGDELAAIADAASTWGVPSAASRAFAEGGQGAMGLAEIVRSSLDGQGAARPATLYDADQPLDEKIRVVAREIYGADDVTFAEPALRRLEQAEASGFGRLPVCIAKTQYSLTDDPHVSGAAAGFLLRIRDVEVRGGAGFVLALAGEMMTMPALPAKPRAWSIDLLEDGTITGIA